MAVDQFCLKWNNFQTSIIHAFESLQTTQDLADVTLTCEGINIKAHKIILSACSPYFRTVFKENPCPHPIVILKDVFYVDLLAVLNFMYHGEVLVSKDHLKSFLQTAEALQVSGLNGYTDFNVNNLPTGKTISKVQKSSRPLETTETAAKRIKTGPKSKQTKNVSPSRSNEALPTPTDSSPKDEANKLTTTEDFEMVQIGKIKTEVSEDDYSLDCVKGADQDHNNVGEDKLRQSSILEAALDAKEQGSSILERSLMSVNSSAKSPTASIPFPLEPVTILQSSPDISKMLLIPRKSPDEVETMTAKQKLLDPVMMSSLDLSTSNETLHSAIKMETEYKSTDGNSDSLVITHCDPNAQASRIPDHLHPHHSSQCGNCPHCGKIYSNQSALKYHVRLMHSDLTNMYCCHLCPESFDYREGYKKHMVEVHSIRN